MLMMCLFVSYAHVNLCHFFSSSWCQGLAAACGSSWTFLFTFFHLVPLNQQVLKILARTFVESFKHTSILRFAVLKLTKLLLDSKLLDVGDQLYHIRCVTCSWETEKIKKYS